MNIKRLGFRLNAVYLVLVMILIYTAIFSNLTIMENKTFQTNAYDLGMFLNSYWNTVYQDKFFYTTLTEGSIFQNHFSPILFLFLGIYRALPNIDILAEVLLSFQSLVIALGALPIYWITKNELNKKAGVVFSLMYLTYPALHGINMDFHELAFVPTFILFAFYYFKKEKYNMSGLFIMLALISREDVAIVIIPMALLWLWESKKSIKDNKTIFCILVIFISWIWFLIVTQMIVHIPEGYITGYSASYLLLGTNQKVMFLVDLFLPLFFISLFNRLILLAFPIFATILFSNGLDATIINQQTALIVPFMFLSSIYFAKNASENEYVARIFSTKIVFPILMLYLTMSFFMCPFITDILSHNTIPRLVVVPDGGPISQNRVLTLTPHYKALNQVIDMIPINASVYTQSNIFPHMADRPKVYYVLGDNQIFKGWNNEQIAQIVPWKDGNIPFDYVLVDNSDDNGNSGTLKNLDIESVEILQKNYGLYLAIDQIYLFKKGYNYNNSIGNSTNTMNNVNFTAINTNVNSANGSVINDPVNTVDVSPSLLKNFDNGYMRDYYNGVLISYYNNNNLSGYPVLTDRVENINFNWNKLSPVRGVINKDNFSVRFDGFIYVPQNGYYSFQLMSDGGAMLYIDGQLAIDAWLSKHQVEESYQNYLTTGLHRIHIDYKERKDNTWINLNWYTPWKGLFEPIPEEYLYIPKNLTNATIITNVSMINNNNASKINNSNLVIIS